MPRSFFILTSLMAFSFLSSFAEAHARLTNPVPRSTNAGIKDGPCGGLSRSLNPLVVKGGQPLTVTWQETVNHPGKFLFAISMSGDNFSQIKQVPDNQTGPLPHLFSTTLNIPNVNCNTCTIQMIQSMEENPDAPSFYYSCADINIVASTTTTTVETQQSTPAPKENAAMAACGLIKNQGGGPRGPASAKMLGLMSFLLMSPLALLIALRRREVSISVRKLKNSFRHP